MDRLGRTDRSRRCQCLAGVSAAGQGWRVDSGRSGGERRDGRDNLAERRPMPTRRHVPMRPMDVRARAAAETGPVGSDNAALTGPGESPRAVKAGRTPLDSCDARAHRPFRVPSGEADRLRDAQVRDC
jgi:hypothetical protein